MLFHENIVKDFSRAKKYFEDIVHYTIGPYSLDDMLNQNVNKMNILDVRDYDDYIDGHIPYAVHTPYKEVENNLEILDKDKVTIVYSYSDSCPRAYKAALALVDKHYPAVVLRGGFKLWKKFDFDVVKNDSLDYKDSDCEN